MAKHIKFPLVMGNEKQVRDIEGLRENFDMVAVVEYFTTGKLQQWLDSNYYDDILEEVEGLTGKEENFGELLAEALGADWKKGNDSDLHDIMKKTELKEQMKPFVSEEQLEQIEYIADSQEELEKHVKAVHTPVYLFGEEFVIKEWMKHIECIGINHPTINLEIKSREEYREKKIKLREVEFATDEMKKVALDEPILEVYYNTLNVLQRYLDAVQTILGEE